MTKKQKERVAKLVSALRSEEFKVTREGQLRSGTSNRFCCLGVACEVYRRTTRKGSWDAFGTFNDGVEDDSRSYLPDAVKAWYGFEYCNPVIGGTQTGGEVRADHYNDAKKESFAKIADRFEETFLAEAAK